MDTHTAIVPADRGASGAAAVPPASLDQSLYRQIAWWTRGLSPASLVSAYFDWLVHLAGSPDKQLELVSKAQRKLRRLGLHAVAHGAEECEPCIEPLPQDRRFTAPEWQRWPFDLIYQAFLLQQQWWYNATTDVPGVTRHHEQLWTFAVRQTLDTFAPSNFIATNPLVLAETWRRGGINLVEGLHNWIQDAGRLAAGKPRADSGQYVPGKGVALTPGKVVFRNRLIELIAVRAAVRHHLAGAGADCAAVDHEVLYSRSVAGQLAGALPGRQRPHGLHDLLEKSGRGRPRPGHGRLSQARRAGGDRRRHPRAAGAADPGARLLSGRHLAGDCRGGTGARARSAPAQPDPAGRPARLHARSANSACSSTKASWRFSTRSWPTRATSTASRWRVPSRCSIRRTWCGRAWCRTTCWEGARRPATWRHGTPTPPACRTASRASICAACT